MTSHRHREPQRTHADFLGAATGAYADAHERLRTVAQRAADEAKRKADDAAVVAAIRTRSNNTPTHNQ